MRWLLALAVLAPAEFALSAAPTCKIEQFAQLPVTMSGTRPLVAAKINGTDVVFVADSGAFYSMLTPATANDLKLPLGPAPTWLQVVGANGSVDIHLTTVKELTLAKVPIRRVDFLVGGSEVGDGAVGLLGQNVWRLADVEYDLAHGVIRLIRTKDCRGVALNYWDQKGGYSELDIQFTTAAEPHTVGVAYLNGSKLRVVFDSGAATSVVSRKAAEKAGVDLKAPGVVDGGMHGGLGRKVYPTWIVPVESFKVGEEEIRNTRLRVAELVLFNGDMLLGADFFLSHRIYVSNEYHKVYFTYNGGPVFNLATGHSYDVVPTATADSAAGGASADSGQANPTPTDAEGFSRRGAAFMARQEFDRAIADLTQATTMAPDQASYQYELGMAYYANRQPLPALSSLDAAIRLAPGEARYVESRADVRLYGGDRAGAHADADIADALVPRDSDLRRNLSHVYLSVGDYEQAVHQLDLWLSTHSQDAGMAAALNQRCWARALWNRDLQLALGDCNDAAKRSPKSAAILDSRGLVKLRLGDYAGAIADFDAALVLSPKLAWSLYGLGVAKQRLGRGEEGKADVSSALAVDRDIVRTASKVGVLP